LLKHNKRPFPLSPPPLSPNIHLENSTRGRKTPKARKPSTRRENISPHLPVGLCDALELVLLLDGVAVAAALCGVDELLGQALGDGLDVAEGGFAGADGEEGDGLVDAAQRGDIDGLTADGTCGTDAGRVLARAAVDDGVDGNLQRVCVGRDVDLRRAERGQSLVLLR